MNCAVMETRKCPGKECPTLGCARFSREEDEWTAEEIANNARLSVPQKGH
jgi:hypothetical protein